MSKQSTVNKVSPRGNQDMLFELGGVTSACVRTKKKNKTSMIVADRGKSHQNKHRNNVG
jgi:hypothetical protein